MLRAETEERALLFLIEQSERVPGGITSAGWRAYSTHPNKVIRIAILHRTDCPSEICQNLLSDKDPEVRAVAQRKAGLLQGPNNNSAK